MRCKVVSLYNLHSMTTTPAVQMKEKRIISRANNLRNRNMQLYKSTKQSSAEKKFASSVKFLSEINRVARTRKGGEHSYFGHPNRSTQSSHCKTIPIWNLSDLFFFKSVWNISVENGYIRNMISLKKARKIL